VLRSGVVIAEKYRVDEAIARGGFSVIYRGTHIEMQRPVALKLLTIDDDIKASWLERFTREARLASQLTHPNTVTIFDYGQDARGFLYIVMEWVDGVSLYHHLKQFGPLSPPDVAGVIAQILLSLGEAHRRGFLHRDLKPSNIMLSHDYEGEDVVKVLDFGIAKHLEGANAASDTKDAARITHQGAFIGTPRYASPEQLDGKELTSAADIYSLGLLMWEALVGDPAVASVEYGECVKKHLGSDPWRLPPSVQCPPGLAVILYKALAKPIDERFSSCAAMHSELVAWLESPEAVADERQNFFVSSTSLGGFKPSGKGSDSSPVDEDELFAGLGEESHAQDDPPLDLHGPGGRSYESPDQREQASGQVDDTFERELLALADITSSEANVGADKPAMSPDDPPPEAEVKQPSPPNKPLPGRVSDTPSSSPNQLTLIVSTIAAVLVLGAGAYAFLSGDEPNPASDEANGVAAEADPAEATPTEASLDDGTPTYAAGLFWRAVAESDWRRIGKVDKLDFDDVKQSSARFRKQAMTVSVTVYETDSFLSAEQYVQAAEQPVQVIRFGKTAVQVSPGAKGNSTRGVYDLMSGLFQLKAIAQEKRE
jgi:serine/threonine-protein kinase